ncbi:MAG TPA: hypothetical protein VIG54_05555 [Lysobacter sp.]
MTSKNDSPRENLAYARRPDLSRQITSDRIDEHMAKFIASGGVVEVLGNTDWNKRQATAAVVKPAKPRTA